MLMVSEVSIHHGREGTEEQSHGGSRETEKGTSTRRSQGRMYLHGHALQCSTPSSQALLPPDDVITL